MPAVVAWAVWVAVSVVVVWVATVVVGGILIGDWDNPVPPHRAVTWTIAGVAAALTLVTAWLTHHRGVKIAAVAALPLHAWLWAAVVIPAIEPPYP